MTKRTTINIPDDLWKAAKIQAFEAGKNFQDLVADRLSQGLGAGVQFDPRLFLQTVEKLTPMLSQETLRAIEKLAQPTLVSEETIRKVFGARDEAFASFEQATNRFLKDKPAWVEAYERAWRNQKEKADKLLAEELRRGGERWAQIDASLRIRTTPAKAKRTPDAAKAKKGRRPRR